MVPVAIVQVRGSKPSLGVIGHWIVLLLNLQNVMCVISEQKYFNQFNQYIYICKSCYWLIKKNSNKSLKIPWFCIYFTQNENGKLIFELPYTARVRMFLFWPALKDRTHKQTDISFSTEIQAELDDLFKPWKNRSKSDDFTESNKKFKNLIIVHNLKPYGFLKQNVLY